MSRFLFLSWCKWGHIDLGGLGFYRTAEKLVKQGHDVNWLFSDSPSGGSVNRLITNAGINILPELPHRLVLSGINQNINHVLWSINAVSSIARNLSTDILVAERTISLGGMAADLADIPYASMGADGEAWRRSRAANGMPYIIRGEKSRFANNDIWSALGRKSMRDPRLASDWLISPYLNISFFPRSFYTEPGQSDTSFPCHYVGSEASTPPEEQTNRLLLTLGNSFHPESAAIICDLLSQVSINQPAMAGIKKITILTGKQHLTETLSHRYGNNPCLEFITWGGYEELFRTARAAIGHGGNAFTWECMKAGIPAIIISPHVSDQIFNASRLESLGPGQVLEKDQLNIDTLQKALTQALTSSKVRAATEGICKLTVSGGGVMASTALLEKLASDKRPVEHCLTTPCCCETNK